MAEALRATVKLLKPFDGNPSHLESFISQIDTFYTRYFNNDAGQREFVNLAIKSKITGAADDFILSRPDLENWDEIKPALRLKFSDPITRANLQQQLIFSTRNKNENILEYISRLKLLLHKLNDKMRLEVANVQARQVLIQQNELTATQNLYANTSDDLQTILMVHNPQTLDAAIEIATNYELISNQLKHRNQHMPRNQNTQQTQSSQNRNSLLPLIPQPQYQRRPQQLAFPSQPIPIYPRQQIQRQYPTNRQVFGPPPRPQNAFPKNTHQPLPKPTPMSISGVNVSTRQMPPQQPPRIQQQFQHQTRTHPRFVFEELTNLEQDECSNSEYQKIYYDNLQPSYQAEFLPFDQPQESEYWSTQSQLNEQYKNYEENYQSNFLTPDITENQQDFQLAVQKTTQP